METTVKVAAVMTAPRYEAVWVRNIIERSLHQVGIPLCISGGVYYGQCMQIMLEDLCGQDCDFALTVDFDSVFTPRHVRRLVSIMAQETHIDALAPLQTMRGTGRVLGSRGREEALEWNGRPVQVDTAHFGLTLIRLEKLRQVPKPWFISVPNAEGRWTGDKLDDDVYFWDAWKRAGNTIYVDPGTRLGHYEEMVTVFNERLEKVHVYPNEWAQICESAVD